MGRAADSARDSTGAALIEHRSHRLADGREAVFFSDSGTAPVEHVVDDRPLGERSGHGQVRFDRLTGEWVAVA
ncbi:MAG: galactose-1-phosphate uridylyltransferase, partial [Kocuria sp.]|nr:galactose-1-phosphate uridylyltransferase [Kocuria sp.]